LGASEDEGRGGRRRGGLGFARHARRVADASSASGFAGWDSEDGVDDLGRSFLVEGLEILGGCGRYDVAALADKSFLAGCMFRLYSSSALLISYPMQMKS